MKVLKSFVYGKEYAGYEGSDITIKDEKLKESLIKKGIIEDTDKKVSQSVYNKDKH